MDADTLARFSRRAALKSAFLAHAFARWEAAHPGQSLPDALGLTPDAVQRLGLWLRRDAEAAAVAFGCDPAKLAAVLADAGR